MSRTRLWATELASWLRALAALGKDQGQIPAPIWWPTIICHSSPRRSNADFDIFGHQANTDVVHRHIHRQNTHTHKVIKQIFKIKKTTAVTKGPDINLLLIREEGRGLKFRVLRRTSCLQRLLKSKGWGDHSLFSGSTFSARGKVSRRDDTITSVCLCGCLGRILTGGEIEQETIKISGHLEMRGKCVPRPRIPHCFSWI